jgi:hypothetical protein
MRELQHSFETESRGLLRLLFLRVDQVPTKATGEFGE